MCERERENQWRSQDLLSSGAQNGRACAPAKILKPRPFPVKICVFCVCTRALQYDQSRCRSAKDQCASEKALAITTTRLPVINYMAGHLVVHCIVAQDVPTNGGAPPHLVGPRPH